MNLFAKRAETGAGEPAGTDVSDAELSSVSDRTYARTAPQDGPHTAAFAGAGSRLDAPFADLDGTAEAEVQEAKPRISLKGLVARIARRSPWRSDRESRVHKSIVDGEEAAAEQVTLEALVDRITGGRSSLRRDAAYWTLVAASPMIALFMVADLVSGDIRWSPVCVLALVFIRAFVRQNAQLEMDRAALANSDLDNRWFGPLCEALEWPDWRVRGVAARLLAQFLKRLRKEDAAGFRDEHRTCLYRRLRFQEVYSRPDLALAVLRVLPHIGSEAGLSYVERLADGYAFTRDGRRVRRAASETLPALERRIAECRAEQVRLAGDEATASENREIAADSAAMALTSAEQVRIDAEYALADREMEEFETALKQLASPGMRAGYLVASWCIILPFFVVQAFRMFFDHALFAGALCVLGAGFTTQMYRWTMGTEHKRLARKLTKVTNVQCVGRLAEILEWPDASVRDLAKDALTRLLRRVKATDRVLTSPRERGYLLRALTAQNAYRDAEFMEAILSALGQVGDEFSVPFVKPLATAQPTSDRHRRVREAAVDCLDALTVRVELSRSSQTLLRGAAQTVAGPDVLMRAVDGQNGSDPAQLLRADVNG